MPCKANEESTHFSTARVMSHKHRAKMMKGKTKGQVIYWNLLGPLAYSH